MTEYEFEHQFFHFCRKGDWNFSKNFIESVDCFRSFVILIILSILIDEHRLSFLFYVVLKPACVVIIKYYRLDSFNSGNLFSHIYEV